MQVRRLLCQLPFKVASHTLFDRLSATLPLAAATTTTVVSVVAAAAVVEGCWLMWSAGAPASCWKSLRMMPSGAVQEHFSAILKTAEPQGNLMLTSTAEEKR